MKCSRSKGTPQWGRLRCQQHILGIRRTSAGLLGSAWLDQAWLLGLMQLCCAATMSTASIKMLHLYSLIGNDVLPPSPGPQQHSLVRARHSLLVLALQATAAHQQ